MNNIKWEDGAVCYADGQQWFPFNGSLTSVTGSVDFQLNTIERGDYIKVSELDTEQKYNDVVEKLWLFGFENHLNYEDLDLFDCLFVNLKGEIHGCYKGIKTLKRELAFPQIIAIGELKRLIGNRDKSAPKTAPDLTPDVEINVDWSDEHYNHFYHLTDKDVELGKIKVDAYFVNRMWKINSWEDTGAGFHILKTLPRIVSNKNSLKRELTALKKQVNILCKLHGVDDDTN